VVGALNSFYSSVDGVLFNKSQTTLVQFPGGKAGSYTIPDNVTSVGNHAFDSCTSLTSITISDSVSSLGSWAFFSCSSLSNATIGNSVSSIGDYTFHACTSLTSITIPDSVSSLGSAAFGNCTSLMSVTLGKSVTSIADSTFSSCTSLTALTVDALNSFYSSVDGVLFNKSQTTLVQFPGGKTGSYTIPSSVTSIGCRAFLGCPGLTNVTIPSGVTGIGERAFSYCAGLVSAYFQGNAPSIGVDVFKASGIATVYYLPGTTGWDSTFGGRPTALWMLPNPLILNNGPGFGVHTNGFGFIISWATNIPVVVEACTSLANPIWSPVNTNTLTDGTSYFSDPDWTNYPARFYRLRSP
jgi:hypothetical protein